jgi:CubicO group peptidase (beta-lactamase class C family)
VSALESTSGHSLLLMALSQLRPVSAQIRRALSFEIQTRQDTMTRRWKAGLALACSLWTLSCSAPPDSTLAQIEPDRLADLQQAISGRVFGNIHGVIANVEGERAVEWYFSGEDQRAGTPAGVVEFDSAALHDVRSLTKSVVSLLFGIALSEDAVGSADDSITEYLSDYSDLLTPETEKIRLRHLLSMTSGLGWDERTYPYTDPRNSETALDSAPDRIEYVLSLPVEAPPGERFVYSSGDVDLLAQILARATGVPLDRYAREVLFDPLGIEDFEWAEYQSGGVIASWGLRLRPRDMEKLGRLVLQSGLWGRQEIVPTSWIGELTAPTVQINAERGVGYGNYWWFGRLGEEEGAIDFMQAVGNGGQRIALFRDQDLLIVTTAGFYGGDDSQSDDLVRSLYRVLVSE